jgi:hypothetical protein
VNPHRLKFCNNALEVADGVWGGSMGIPAWKVEGQAARDGRNCGPDPCAGTRQNCCVPGMRRDRAKFTVTTSVVSRICQPIDGKSGPF